MHMTSPLVRAIVGARVSHVQGPQKTSHLVQHETGGKYAAGQGWDVVGSFEDLDVSAVKTTPWQRPDLGPWLSERAHEWDALIVAKTDRLFRSAKDCVDLSHWAEQNRKILVFVDDGLRLDFHTPENERDPFSLAMTKVFLLLASVFAEMEGKQNVRRSQDRVRFLRQTDRWGWGVPPYGFVIVDHLSGKGKALDLDPEMQAVIHSVADRLIEGASLTGLVADLNDRGVLSPRDVRRVRRGDAAKGDQWTVGKLQHILTSPATQGLKLVDSRPALREDGSAIRVGPPSFEPAVWDVLQRTMAERAGSPHTRRHTSNPLLGVGYCQCGKSLAQRSVTTTAKKTHRYYLCGGSPQRCSNRSFRADDAEELLEREFLRECGDLSVLRRVFVPGEDSSYELAEVNRTIEGLRQDRAAGLFPEREDELAYRAQMAALLGRRKELSARPTRAAGYDYVPTGQTYAEEWAARDAEGRRQLLVDAGVRFILHAENHAVALVVPPDARERMQKRPPAGR